MTKKQVELWMSPNMKDTISEDHPQFLMVSHMDDIAGCWHLKESKRSSYSFEINLINIDGNEYKASIKVLFASQTITVDKAAYYEKGVLTLSSPVREPISEQAFTKLYTIQSHNRKYMLPSAFVKWIKLTDNVDNSLLVMIKDE